MKKIWSFLVPLCCILFLGALCFLLEPVSDFFLHLIEQEPKIVIPLKSEYAKNENFLFIQQTDDFTPLSIQDIRNIFYTVVNNGWKEFTFYCPKEYTNCLEDVKEFSKNQDLITHINNFVHPYNSFYNAKTAIDPSGEITMTIDYLYDEEAITKINQKINEITQKIITDDMDTETKILTIHDYLINTTKYDVERNNKQNSPYTSYTAYGPLMEGYATCNGYTDAMALFLTNLKVPNFKVAMTPQDPTKEGHVWNAVYLNQKWLHLDLTWDDPVSKDGKDYLQHKYFLITTAQLKEVDSGEIEVTEHDFKTNIYLELKNDA